MHTDKQKNSHKETIIAHYRGTIHCVEDHHEIDM